MHRWCLLRATCTAAREAMPLLMRLSDVVLAYGSRQLFYTSVEPVVRADDLLRLLGHSQTGAAGTGVSLAEEVGDATARAAGSAAARAEEAREVTTAAVGSSEVAGGEASHSLGRGTNRPGSPG